PERLGRHAPQDLLDGQEVAERLRHLLLVDAHERMVQPVAHERRARRALRLRDLVLVVREDEVLAATVQVERLAEGLRRHRGALEVPARTSRSPRTLPERLARLHALPEREIERLALPSLVDLDPGAGDELVELPLRELAVAGDLADRAIDVAVRRVGEA